MQLSRTVVVRGTLVASIAILPAAHTIAAQDSSVVIPADSIPRPTRVRADANGADVAIIIPDSLPDMPRTMSELLAARVPGVSVQRSSGAVGASSWISMRDAGAVQGFDPLVIVDGVRRVATITSFNVFNGSRLEVSGERLAPSPIDDIPVEQVERVEILRGPAAAARYGRDAKYGVIIVTTKRPTTGAPRFHASVTGGLADERASFPGNVARLDANGYPCPNANVAPGYCTQASTATYSVLRDRSPFATGTRRGAAIDASAGIGRVALNLGATHDHTGGVLPMDGADQTAITARALAPFGSRVRLSVNAQTSLRGVTQPSQGESNIEVISGGIYGGPIDCSSTTPCVTNSNSHGYWFGAPDHLAGLGPRHRLQHYSEGAILDIDPTPWLSLQSTVSLDGMIDRGKRMDTSPGDPFQQYLVQQDVVSHGTRFTLEQSLRGTWTLAGLPATTIFAAHSERDRSHASYAMFSSTEYNGTIFSSGAWGATRIADSRKSIHLEQRVALGAHADLGAGAIWSRTSMDFTSFRLPPMLDAFADASWMVVDSTNALPLLHSVRLRAAAGQVSGYDVRALARIPYVPLPPYLGGGQQSPASPQLRPQRAVEIEGGMDAVLLPAQLRVSVTAYQRTEADPYVAAEVPQPSGQFYAVTPLRRRMSGVEMTSTATLAVGRVLRWTATGSLALSRDRVVRWQFGPRTVGGTNGALQVVKEGKSFGGWTARPSSWSDTNGDGIIGRDEVTYPSDYDPNLPVTASRPTRTASLQNYFTVLGAVTLGTQLDYVGGHQVLDRASLVKCLLGTCAALNITDTPLGDQARAVSAYTQGSAGGFLESGAAVRLRELSATMHSARLAGFARAGSLSFTLAGRNLATWSRYKGLDGEIDLPDPGVLLGANNGYSTFYLPNSRQLTARLTLAY